MRNVALASSTRSAGQAQIAVVLQRCLDEALQQGIREVRLPGKFSRMSTLGA